MTEMAWSGKETPVEFKIECEPFGIGGFRKAFKASGSGEFKGSTWVVKRYLENAKKDILELGQSLEEHTKKVVQMHYLARNFTAKLKEELVAQDNEILFGETFSYKKIFMGKIGEEYVTIEEFVDGTFRKYVNNNGNVCCKGGRSALFDKAECCWTFKGASTAWLTLKLPLRSSTAWTYCFVQVIFQQMPYPRLLQIVSAAVTVNCWGFLHWRDKLFSSPILTQT